MADIATEAALKVQRREAAEEGEGEEEDGSEDAHDNSKDGRRSSTSTQKQPKGKSQQPTDNNSAQQRDKTVSRVEPQVRRPPGPQGRDQMSTTLRNNVMSSRTSLLDDEYYTGLTGSNNP